MNIVLDEYEWARQAVQDKRLGSRPSETLTRVSKYYMKDGYSARDTRRLLDIFLLQCDPNISLPGWSDTLDRAVRNAAKYPLIQIDGVSVTKPEMARIGTLPSKKLRKLAFALLASAKYWDAASEKNDHWVNTPDGEIVKMANIHPSVREQSLMFGELRDAGLIGFSRRVDNLNVKVLFVSPGDEALCICDFRNLGWQYLRCCGEPYFECASCGVVSPIRKPNRGRRQKYCPACAQEIKARQSVLAMNRRRENARQSSQTRRC